jgi:hypothetical protein
MTVEIHDKVIPLPAEVVNRKIREVELQRDKACHLENHWIANELRFYEREFV